MVKASEQGLGDWGLASSLGKSLTLQLEVVSHV